MPAARPAPLPPAEPNREPVGTPPGGGRWTWDFDTCQWVPLPDQAAAPTPTDTAPKE